jgi:hypothetical protein
VKVIHVEPGQSIIPIPQEWGARHYNGSNEPCDVLQGPCSCGAWHNVMEWWVQELLQAFKTTIVFEQPVTTRGSDGSTQNQSLPV